MLSKVAHYYVVQGGKDITVWGDRSSAEASASNLRFRTGVQAFVVKQYRNGSRAVVAHILPIQQAKAV